MPFPANLTTVTVVGSFITPEGTASTGTVTFTASSWLTNSGANLSIPNSAVTKTLGTAGDFSATIPITDDADISPTGWVYTVAEVVDGVSRSYDVTIPGTVVAGGTVYLADLTPAAAAGPEYYSLASSLSIGTVSTLAAGSAATATITGLAPNQTLNLGIPTGNTGATGAAATITVGTIGSTAYPGPGTVTNSGTSGAAVLNFVLVTGPTGATGATGATGPAASLGAVTPQALGVAAAGSSGTASREDHVHSSTVANPTFTGQVIVPAGSAGAPAIAPTGDTNTGIYSSGADTVNIATGGTERMRVDSNGLITGTGTSLGAWTAYTPTLGNTWAIGNGTVAGFYCQVGKTVAFRAVITLGSTSTFGSASPTVTLPVTAKAANLGSFTAYFSDSSAGAIYQGAPWMTTTSVVAVRVLGASGAHGTTNSTTPFTWADADAIIVTGVYEIA